MHAGFLEAVEGSVGLPYELTDPVRAGGKEGLSPYVSDAGRQVRVIGVAGRPPHHVDQPGREIVSAEFLGHGINGPRCRHDEARGFLSLAAGGRVQVRQRVSEKFGALRRDQAVLGCEAKADSRQQ
ncbi:hypothetical protein [Streptomyces nojiriensis]|uniref:hypothetical protein n=1 Tax=Streptomyces nojiriensis TaxID=66374 RepID=UPI0027E4C276|nr:hypothetical protein [Streptomyces nojiriensis]